MSSFRPTWFLAINLALIAAVLLVVDLVDHRRSEHQLEQFEMRACGFEPPPRMLDRLERLDLTDYEGFDERIELLSAFSRHLAHRVDDAQYVRILAQADGELLWVSERYPSPAGWFLERHWGTDFSDEPDGECRGVRSGDKLMVARLLHTPNGGRVVLLFYLDRR